VVEKEDEKNDMDCYPSFWNSFVVDTFVVDMLAELVTFVAAA
jgi:hypothetical protein